MQERTEGYGYSCQGGRPENEDSYGLADYGDNCCAVVADGLGGHGGGKQASQTAVRILSSCGESGKLPSEEEIYRAFTAANDEIMEKRRDENHMKTTAVYLCVHENQAVWAHIGDSRLYHFRDESLCDYTLDHSVSQMAVALGEIRREEIPGHCDRSRLLRVLGDEELKPEIHEPVYLEPGRHAFLLCTDGFWESVREEEMLLDLCKTLSPEEWLKSLYLRIMEHQGEEHDNHTAVAVFAMRSF